MSGEPPESQVRQLWGRALLLTVLLSSSLVGQFALSEEADRVGQVSSDLATVDGAERSEALLLVERAERFLADPAARGELRGQLLEGAETLTELHQERVRLAALAPGPPVGPQAGQQATLLSEEARALATASTLELATGDQVATMELALAGLTEALTVHEDAHEASLATTMDRHAAWGVGLLGLGLGAVLLAVGMVAIPAQRLARNRLDAADRKRLDLTEEMAREKAAAEEQAREMEQTIEELEQFAYVASHDLQEPLRMITSYVQLIERRYEEVLDQDGREYMAFIVEGAARMKQLIDALLAYSRVQTQEEAYERVSLRDVVDDALENLSTALEATGAEVKLGELPAVEGDPVQLTRVFQNLIGNALKYQRPSTTPSVRVTAERDGDWWTVSVADNGIGIEEEHRERIFVIFQRLHDRASYEGTGIGLAVTRKIVERHHGRIWVQTPEVGPGSVFKFTLPAIPKAVPEPEDPTPEAPTFQERTRELV